MDPQKPPRRKTIHSMNRRARFHDYRRPGVYLVTLVVKGRRSLFGRLAGTPTPHVDLSPLGQCILLYETGKMSAIYPQVKVLKVVIMPDHIHLIIHILSPLPSKKSLGTLINGFKTGCRKVYRLKYPEAKDGLFIEDYNDKILMRYGTLGKWAHYLDDNPRRLWIKRQHPDLFTVVSDLTIAGVRCQMIGNRFLLDIPDKEAVIVHRAYDDAEYKRLFDAWMQIGENGGVLVSAAISPREKTVLREALNRGYAIIHLQNRSFPKMYKPPGEFFDACAKGQLLQISTSEQTSQSAVISREQCLRLNALAEAIAAL